MLTLVIPSFASKMEYQTGDDAPECCQRRQLGLPVSCCDSLPRDEWVKPKTPDQWRWVAEAKTKKGVLSWMQNFFSGLWADILSVFKKKQSNN